MFCRNLLKLRITVQPMMQKARVVEPKTQCSFVDSYESSVGLSVWWVWLEPFARCTCIDRNCCKFLAQLCWLPPWLERSSHLCTPTTSPFRPTLGLEVYEFYLNLLSFSVFLPSLLWKPKNLDFYCFNVKCILLVKWAKF